MRRAAVAREAWRGLAGAAHHHVYELAPTAAELREVAFVGGTAGCALLVPSDAPEEGRAVHRHRLELDLGRRDRTCSAHLITG